MRRVSMLLAVLLVLGGSALGGCGTAAPAPAASADTSGAGSRHASADVTFVQALIPHHRQGIALASAVARQPAARTLAEAIIVTQQDEVARMSGWLREWSASLPPSAAAAPSGAAPSGAASSAAAPSGGGSSSTARSAAASDRAAADPIRALIAHQEEAIRLAQQEQANGTNPAALAFAKQIVESRAEEIAQLRTYLG
jgi:uncharacterized protein (DUF305 family)